MAKSNSKSKSQKESGKKNVRISEVKIKSLAEKLNKLEGILSDDEKVVLAAIFKMINTSFCAVRAQSNCNELTINIPEDAAISVEWDSTTKIPAISKAFEDAFKLTEDDDSFSISGLEIDTALSGTKCVAAASKCVAAATKCVAAYNC